MSLLLAPNYPRGSVAAGAPALADETIEGILRAQYKLGFDGFIYHSSGPIAVRDVAWITPQEGMSEFECRATAIDISPPPGPYDEWLDLTNSWVWGWLPIDGANDGSFLIEIRRKSDLVVVASATIRLIVDGRDTTGTL